MKEAEVVAKARDIVNNYDELINKLKILKEKIRESPDLFKELSLYLTKIYNITKSLLKICNSTTEYSEDYRKYLEAYCEYIVLISIPYVIDLLKNMRDNSSNDIKNNIEEFVIIFTELIKKASN